MVFIPVEELSQKYQSTIQKFLCKYEAGCVQLCARLKKSIEGAFVIFINEISVKEIYGVISLKGTFLFCLPFIKNTNQSTALKEDFIQSFSLFYKQIISTNEKLKGSMGCIGGLDAGAKLIIEVLSTLGVQPAQINEYDLMALDIKQFSNSTQISVDSSFKIIKCKTGLTSDLQLKLEQIQYEYEKEEVLPSNMEFDEDSCRLRLKNAQRTQLILALIDKENNFLSKVATNAIGYKCIQIGGVYTKPDYRKRHYSKYLMGSLCTKIIRIRRLPVLFVKKDNLPAQRLYLSLGFKTVGSYCIAYF